MIISLKEKHCRTFGICLCNFCHVHLRRQYPKFEDVVRQRTHAVAADAAKDEQLALAPWQTLGVQVGSK